MHNERFWWDVTLTVEAAVAACDQGVDPDEAGCDQGGSPVERRLSQWADLGRAWAIHQALQHWRQAHGRSGEAATLALWQGVARRGRAVELAQQIEGEVPALPAGVHGVLVLMLQAQAGSPGPRKGPVPRPTQTFQALFTDPRYQPWREHESWPGVPDVVWSRGFLNQLYGGLTESNLATLWSPLSLQWTACSVDQRYGYLSALLAQAVQATADYTPGAPETQPDPYRRHGALWNVWQTLAGNRVRADRDTAERLWATGELQEALGAWRPKLYSVDDHARYGEICQAFESALTQPLAAPAARLAWHIATLPLPSRRPVVLAGPQQTALTQWAHLIRTLPGDLRTHLPAAVREHLAHFPELFAAMRGQALAQQPSSSSRPRRRA